MVFTGYQLVLCLLMVVLHSLMTPTLIMVNNITRMATNSTCLTLIFTQSTTLDMSMSSLTIHSNLQRRWITV